MIIAKGGRKCDIAFLVKMGYLWSTLDSIVQNHIGHLTIFTQNISKEVKDRPARTPMWFLWLSRIISIRLQFAISVFLKSCTTG